ncbi:hypothetical protein H4582DRAFT_2080937 [Lactarius indigo]|nr:hypothetical protein H4582DRAFT_2080937 [Lactarius indigo]
MSTKTSLMFCRLTTPTLLFKLPLKSDISATSQDLIQGGTDASMKPSPSLPRTFGIYSFLNVPPLDNLHHAHQTTTESLRIPITSPDPTAASAILDVVTSRTTTLDPTPGTSASVLLLSFTPLPSAVTLRHNADPLTPSDAPSLLFSSF